MNVFSQIGTPDALRGACPVWEGLGGNRHPKGARRPHSTSSSPYQAQTSARAEIVHSCGP